jgi:hypothetical protein
MVSQMSRGSPVARPESPALFCNSVLKTFTTHQKSVVAISAKSALRLFYVPDRHSGPARRLFQGLPENSKVLQVAGEGADTLFASRIDPADP